MAESKLQRNRWVPLSVLTWLGRENWLEKCQENGKGPRRNGARKGRSRMWRDKVKAKSLDDSMCTWILQKCQRQLEEDANTGGAMGRRGKSRGWEKHKIENPFATLQLKHGGGCGGGGELLGSTGHQSSRKQAWHCCINNSHDYS